MMIEQITLKLGLTLEVFRNREAACQAVADEIGELLASRKRVVMGWATGGTPEPLYEELVRRHNSQGLSFANMVGFNLDEYEGIHPENQRSFRYFMEERLYRHVDAGEANFLPGTSAKEEAEFVCADYEKRIREAGGLDWQLLGIGGNGHIAFNEPGSQCASRTRRIVLDDRTRRDAAGAFDGIDNVPVAALTMGVGTILEARRLVLMAWGAGKAGIVKRALTGEVGEDVPASFLQDHGNVRVVLDQSAASEMLA